ncbi:MAG: hypothetical protein A3G21_06010 [Acidobacteria bacterium RIFCSPLOWO2_12_FULL_66_21]|nr:MAG: hypothetical protein A3G21_06010 [Acidobacteria bacterium RIFCSPLOWO2_12_FULL_66_21]
MHAKHLIAVALLVLTPRLALAQDRPRVPQGPQGTVTMPIGEYNRLVDRAAQPDTTPEPPPVPAVVGRADLRARVAGDTARGTLRLDGEVFQRGQVKGPLVSGATLVDARTDGRPLPLVQESDAHAAVLTGPAPFTVTLDWAAPVTSAPGRATFALPVPAGGTISATLDLPGDPAEVKVEPGVVTRRQTSGGRTTVEVTLEPGRRGQVSWSMRETAAPGVPATARTLADVKSLITIGEADLRMVSLVDVTVVQGEPQTFEVRLPSGFEVSSIAGSSIETTRAAAGAIVLTVHDATVRRHQFLISLEQAHAPGSFKAMTSFPTLTGAQREAGETAIEGIGTLDVTASGDEGLHRMDVRELNATLRSLARQPILAAFRYQRRLEETRGLTLEVKRFADAPVIAAVAQTVVATTLVTPEGRALTEVQLWIRNRAQPFMKVTLPPGATMLSVEVAGETAKPVTGTDGTRVPLLRAGFRPDGVYPVSLVYLTAGEAFGKRGDAQMALPKFDVPMSLVHWELFLPDRYSATPNGGNVIPARLAQLVAGSAAGTSLDVGHGATAGIVGYLPERPIGPGQIVGHAVDTNGATLPGVTITVTASDGVRRRATTDEGGMFIVSSVPSGPVTVTGELAGFATVRRSLTFDQRPRLVDLQMSLATLSETVEVRAEAPVIDQAKVTELQNAPSQNVLNLQRRVAGVLPVRMDVPRSGTAFRFVRPLVLDEETTVSFRYKRR